MKTIGILLGILLFAFHGMAQDDYTEEERRFLKREANKLNKTIDRIGECKTQECLDALSDGDQKLKAEELLKNLRDLKKRQGYCKTKECLKGPLKKQGFEKKCSSSEMQDFTCHHYFGEGGFKSFMACDAGHAARRVDNFFSKNTNLMQRAPTTCDATDGGEYLDDGSAAGS